MGENNKLTCSTHGIALLAWSGGSVRGKYIANFSCPLCGEIQEETTDLETEQVEIKISRKGEPRVHYFKIDSDMNVRIAACKDCRSTNFICVKEKENGVKAAYCPGHKKFIKSWDRVSWDKIPAPTTTLDLKGIITT